MEKNELKGEENEGKKESYARDKNHKLVEPERRKVEAVTTEFKWRLLIGLPLSP